MSEISHDFGQEADETPVDASKPKSDTRINPTQLREIANMMQAPVEPDESKLIEKADRELKGEMLSIEDRMNTLITGLVQNFINDLAENPQTKDMTPEEIADKVWQGLTTLTISKDDIASRIQRLRNK